MWGVLAQAGDPDAFIDAAPETQAYRDKSAIGHLLDSLSMQIEDCQAEQLLLGTGVAARTWDRPLP